MSTVIERRNRAIVAVTWLTGVRDGGLVTLKLRHIDLVKQLVDQDPREVKTKNSKQLRTTFFGVGGTAQQIVEEWIAELRQVHLWGNDDPLFPATAIGQNSERQFAAIGLARAHWATADAVQKTRRHAGLPGPEGIRRVRCSQPSVGMEYVADVQHFPDRDRRDSAHEASGGEMSFVQTAH